MKIIVRRIDTGLYLCLPDTWTQDLSQASVFPNSTDAVALAPRLRIDFEVIFAFDDPQYDVVLRISNSSGPSRN